MPGCTIFNSACRALSLGREDDGSTTAKFWLAFFPTTMSNINDCCSSGCSFLGNLSTSNVMWVNLGTKKDSHLHALALPGLALF